MSKQTYDSPYRGAWGSDDIRATISLTDPFWEELREMTYATRFISIDPHNAGFELCGQLLFQDCKFRRSIPLDNILDIGCGNGNFLMASIRYGLANDCVGIDRSVFAVNAAIKSLQNSNMPIRIIHGNILETTLVDKYDLITSFETLEHIPYLRECLSKIRNMLKEDGIFAGSVPYEKTCDCTLHLHYFNMDSIDNLLRSYFKEVLLKKVDFLGHDNDKKEYHIYFYCEV